VKIHQLNDVFLPHEIRNRAIAVDTKSKVNRNEWILEISMHDKVCVWEPDVIVVVNCIEELIFAPVGVLEAWVKPLLLQKELHFIFLQHNKLMTIEKKSSFHQDVITVLPSGISLKKCTFVSSP
jgi:hypothetical protein